MIMKAQLKSIGRRSLEYNTRKQHNSFTQNESQYWTFEMNIFRILFTAFKSCIYETALKILPRSQAKRTPPIFAGDTSVDFPRYLNAKRGPLRISEPVMN